MTVLIAQIIRFFDIITKESAREKFYAKRYAKKCVKYLRKYRECHKYHRDTLFYDFEEILEEVIKISSNDGIWKNEVVITNKSKEISLTPQR